MTKTKFEVMEMCNEVDIPVGPILSMKEIAEEQSLRDTGTVVEVDHPTRGKYLTVGNPMKMSDSISEVKRSPLLGEHTDEILTKVLGYRQEDRGRDQELGRAVTRRRRRPRRGGVTSLVSPDAVQREARRRRAGHASVRCEGSRFGIAPLASLVLSARDDESEYGERTDMRIVVHGQQAFGKAVLEALLKRGENVVGVYVAPEKPGAKADPLKEAALAAKLPVYQPASYSKPEVWEEFKALKPDLQVMAFVTLFVPEEFLNIPTHGSIQYHPSLLPAYRGASAINWPIIKGEKETGLSIFWPDNGLDTGDVLVQKKTPISDKDTLGTRLFRPPVPDGRRGDAGIASIW